MTVTEPLRIDPFVVDRKSRYAVVAFAVTSEAEVDRGLRDLLRDKRYRAADHHIVAYRMEIDHRLVEHKNDGYRSPSKETGAGQMRLEILRARAVTGWCVVVTRWYGGVHLGADRFRHVRDATAAVLALI
jgi:putative IMPACT (imprinted ancient) family translation regulator